MEPSTIGQTVIYSGIIGAFAASIIAVFTIVQFVFQHRQFEHDKRVANANYKFVLYDKRADLLADLSRFFGDFYANGKPSEELAQKVVRRKTEARMLFGEEMAEYISEIWTRTINHRFHNSQWEPLRARSYAGEKLSQKEASERDDHLQKMHKQV